MQLSSIHIKRRGEDRRDDERRGERGRDDKSLDAKRAQNTPVDVT